MFYRENILLHLRLHFCYIHHRGNDRYLDITLTWHSKSETLNYINTLQFFVQVFEILLSLRNCLTVAAILLFVFVLSEVFIYVYTGALQISAMM